MSPQEFQDLIWNWTGPILIGIILIYTVISFGIWAIKGVKRRWNEEE